MRLSTVSDSHFSVFPELQKLTAVLPCKMGLPVEQLEPNGDGNENVK